MQVETHYYDLHNETNGKNKKSKLDECILSIVKEEAYVSCVISKKVIAADGGGYLATLYEVNLKGRTAVGDRNKEISIFVKHMSPNATMELLSLPTVYKTELYFYIEVMKIFNELQNEGNIPAKERYNTVKCYEESTNEAIIMENLTIKGYKTWNRMDTVTLEMAEECVKRLAKFHCLSFVMEQYRPDYFNSKIKTLKTGFIFGNAWKGLVEKFYKNGMECLDPDIKNKIEDKIPEILKKRQEYYTDESIMCCLCHGDYRPSNIMTKEENGKVTDVIPVDYQLIYYGCPVIDFLYFIYISTDRQFRKSHMVNLKNLYYESLGNFLQYFNMSAESVFPRKVFENLYKDKLDYGLAITFLVCPFVFVTEDEEIPDVTTEDIVEIDYRLDYRFKDRLQDAVEEFIELGYFY